jgi:hypothetical protein
MHGLSCLLSNPLLPTDVAFFNANQNQSSLSLKLTPTASIGIVIADTLADSYTLCRLSAIVNVSMLRIILLVLGTHPVSLLWFVRIILHHTVGVSCLFVQSFIPPPLLLLVVVGPVVYSIFTGLMNSCHYVHRSQSNTIAGIGSLLVHPQQSVSF